MLNKDFNSIIDLLKTFPTEQSCINHLEELRWNGYVVSPFDATSKVYKCRGNKYRCRNTGKYFNVRTNTLFDNTKVELQKWFLAIWLVTSHKKGISSVQLSKDIDVTQKTAWFILKRIRNCFGIEVEKLDNEVEIDETFIGGKNKNRHADKKVKYSQGRSCKDKTPVLGMLERDGELIAKVVEDTKGKTLFPEIIESVKQSEKVMTDEWVGYNSLKNVYDHSYVKHNLGEYVNGIVHTNTIEGFWSLLKRGILGIYHFTSKKHLQMYIDEFAFRYNTKDSSESNRFNLLLCNLENRLTYKELIYGN
jgi:transposase-like protein